MSAIGDEVPVEDPQTLPQRYEQLWITNKRLHKQINILKLEIGEKDRIIKELKLEIDSTILEDTKSRLEYLRMIEDEVTDKTKQVRLQCIEKISELQAQLNARAGQLIKVQEELRVEREQYRGLEQKFHEFKLHVVVALDEKDLLIRELSNIINMQNVEVESKCRKPQWEKMEKQNQKLGQKAPANPVVRKSPSSKVHIKRNI